MPRPTPESAASLQSPEAAEEPVRPESATPQPPAPDSISDSSEVADDDPRLISALAAYVEAAEAGRRPNRQEFLSRYPDIAKELASSLQALAFVHSAAAPSDAPHAAGRRGDSGIGDATTAVAVPRGHRREADQAEAALESEIAEGRPLGDFKLLREIGRGGMGVVYEAMQLSLGRRVAVKVLSFAAALDSRHLQRFRNEAQAAAALHHTNIVPVYSVGCERSVHFYAMQLIEGRSLAQVIQELKEAEARERPGRGAAGRSLHLGRESARRGAAAASWPPAHTKGSQAARVGRMWDDPASPAGGAAPAGASPVSTLTVARTGKPGAYFRTVAKLALQAADALHYAHQKGVVHRDVKPANLLLDHEGNLWVTDFGLAQFYDIDSGLTQTGNLLGTYRYMSPEQASGRAVVLDQRTDVYSLGITLYELLTLRRALPGTTREQLLHEVESVDPAPPRSIDKSIPPELETIVGKAISKEPADRYPSAQAMAEDLGRFLRDEPIRARPPSLADKAVKWTRRHRAAAATALVMLVLVAVGLLVSTLLIAREQSKTKDAYHLIAKEQAKTQEAYFLERRKSAEADKSYKEAREAVDFLTRIASDEMANNPMFTEVRRQLLEASLTYYQSFLDERKGSTTGPTTGPTTARTAAGASELSELSAARESVSSLLAEIATGEQYFRLKYRADLLFQQASVREALHLSAEQAAKIDQAAKAEQAANGGPWFGGFGNLEGLTPQEKRDKYLQKAADIEKRLNELLDPAQRERLQQIYLQERRGEAFTDPEVVEALGLTKEQKEAIRQIRKQKFHAIFIGFGHGPGGPGGPRPDGRGPQDHHRDGHQPPGPPGPPQEPGGAEFPVNLDAKQDKAPEDAVQPAQTRWRQERHPDEILEKILALLTPTQKQIWKEMCGEPFTGPIYHGWGGPSGRGPGGPQPKANDPSDKPNDQGQDKEKQGTGKKG